MRQLILIARGHQTESCADDRGTAQHRMVHVAINEITACNDSHCSNGSTRVCVARNAAHLRLFPTGRAAAAEPEGAAPAHLAEITQLQAEMGNCQTWAGRCMAPAQHQKMQEVQLICMSYTWSAVRHCSLSGAVRCKFRSRWKDIRPSFVALQPLMIGTQTRCSQKA